MRMRMLWALPTLALACLCGCGGYDSQNNSTQNNSQNVANQNTSRNAAPRGGNQNGNSAQANAPKFEGEVGDSETCQPVRKEKIGGDQIYCKGSCPSAASKCGKLESRKRGGEFPWQDEEATRDNPATYEPAKEYRCVCQAAGAASTNANSANAKK